MGAVSIANREQGVHDNKKVVEADITFSNSYATGGDTVAITSLGLVKVDEILIPSHNIITRKAVAAAGPEAGSSVKLTGTAVAPKLALYTAAATEATAASDNSGVTVRVRFLGK